MPSWITVLAMASTLFVTSIQAQQPQPPVPPAAPANAPDNTQSEISTLSTDAAIKVRVNLVLVRVVVRDGDGKFVSGLKQDDFQVFDNGKRHKISSFSVEAAENAPYSGSPRAEANVLPADAMAVHSATKKLFATLTPTDRVAIYSTQGNVQQDFTSDAETLRKTLVEIVPRPAKGEGEHECPNITYYQADLIVNKHDRDAAIVAALDADANQCPTDIRADAQRILDQGDSMTRAGYQRMEEIVEHLAGMPGQRLLVYVSPGFVVPEGVMLDNYGFIERALRAGVVVNTIDARGLYTADALPDIDAPPQQPPPPPPVDSAVSDYQSEEGKYRMQAQFESGQVLAGIAASTGGTFFHNRNDLDVGMNRALEAPKVSYILGFRPANPKENGKFHSLKVKLEHRNKYQIQATNGYYASKIPAESEDAAKQEVRDALFSRDETAGVPIHLQTQFLNIDSTSTQLTVLTHIDIRGLRFRKQEGKSCDDLIIATGVFDTNGQVVDGQMKEVALKLSDSTLETMNQTGLTIKTVVTVKPGSYRVRSVLRDSEGKQLTAQNLMATIPGQQSTNREKKAANQDPRWSPPKIDAPLASLLAIPSCDTSDLLAQTGASALALASNLEKFSAHEQIDYFMLDRPGMVEDYHSGSFQYVYAMERQSAGLASREYRTPIKGTHDFPESGQQVGQAAIALIFLPDLQPDYEMRCEGTDERNGQSDWVVQFQQHKDKSNRVAVFWSNNVAHPGMLKGRAWISKQNFQVVHLEAGLMNGISDIGLEELTLSVDYAPIHTSSGNFDLWLPNRIAAYLQFNAHRTIFVHNLSDFEVFAVETKEKVQEPKQP